MQVISFVKVSTSYQQQVSLQYSPIKHINENIDDTLNSQKTLLYLALLSQGNGELDKIDYACVLARFQLGYIFTSTSFICIYKVLFWSPYFKTLPQTESQLKVSWKN